MAWPGLASLSLRPVPQVQRLPLAAALRVCRRVIPCGRPERATRLPVTQGDTDHCLSLRVPLAYDRPSHRAMRHACTSSGDSDSDASHTVGWPPGPRLDGLKSDKKCSGCHCHCHCTGSGRTGRDSELEQVQAASVMGLPDPGRSESLPVAVLPVRGLHCTLYRCTVTTRRYNDSGEYYFLFHNLNARRAFKFKSHLKALFHWQVVRTRSPFLLP
jgi:hypothetical protein